MQPSGGLSFRSTAAAALALAWLAFVAPKAEARGALGYDQDQCVLKVGPDFLYFSGYQMGAGQRKFCEEVPTIGETTFVFDYAQDELRQMKTDFRIVRDSGETGEGGVPLDGPGVAYLPPQVYPKGTFSFVHRFDEAGNYVGVVTIDGQNGEHWVARFPFSVGGPPTPKTPFVLLGLAAALALTLFLVGRSEKKKA
jgi:hypothetical protein